MPTYIFKYDPLLRYRRNRRYMCRQLLARVLDSARDLAEKRQRMEALYLGQLEEIRELGEAGSVDVDRSSARRYYAGHLRVQIGLLQRNQELVTRQLTSCRESLTKADQAVKVLEKLEERERQEYSYLQERHLSHTLDDVWTAARIVEASQ